MRRGLCIALALAALAAGGCKTMFTKGGGEYRDGEKAYKEGAYDEAAKGAIEALAVNPGFAEAKDLLSRATKDGPASLLKEIEALKSGGTAFAVDDIYKKYKTLERLHKVVSASPLAAQYPTTSYEAEQKAALEQACAEHYAAGAAELKKGGFRAARAALEQFKAVERYTRTYNDLADLEAKASASAVAVVAVVECNGGSGGAYNLEAATVEGFKGSKALDRSLTSYRTSKELGLAPKPDLAKALGAAKAKGADFLVFVDSKAEGRSDNKSISQGEMLAGVFKADSTNYGYTQSYAGVAQAYDVATGAPLGARKDFSKSLSDFVNVKTVYGARDEKVNIEVYGKGSFKTYRVPSIASINPNGPANGVYSSIVRYATDAKPEAIAAAATFAELKKLCDGVIGFDVPVILVYSEAEKKYGGFFSGDRAVNERLAANSAIARDKAMTRAMALSGAAYKDFSSLGAQVAAEISAGLAASLK